MKVFPKFRQALRPVLTIIIFIAVVTALSVKQGGRLGAPPIVDNVYRPVWLFRTAAPPSKSFNRVQLVVAQRRLPDLDSLNVCGGFIAAWGTHTVRLPAACDAASVQIWCLAGRGTVSQSIISDVTLDPEDGMVQFTLSQNRGCGFYSTAAAP